MNIFRTTLEIEDGSLFLVQAVHENKKINCLTASPIIDDVVHPYTDYDLEDLSLLVKKIEILLDTIE